MATTTLPLWRSLFLIALFSNIAGADPIELVVNSNDSGTGSLRYALTQVSNGGTILFSSLLTGDTIVLTSSTLILEKDLSIIGPGQDLLFITSNEQFRIFKQTKNTTVKINGLHLTRGKIKPGTPDVASRGGGIYSEGTLILESCDVTHCSASFGGGIFANNLSIRQCNIMYNTSVLDGGGVNANTINAQNSTIAHNVSTGRLETIRLGLARNEGNGGGMCIEKKMILNQCTISGNKCGLYGGGVYMFSPTASNQLRINSCTIIGNSAEIGGGIYEEFSNIYEFSNNIVATNRAAFNEPDFFNGGMWMNPLMVNNNLIGQMTGTQIPGKKNQVGSSLYPLYPLLDSLRDNGGFTMTNAIMECSPAIDAGFDVGLSSFDQRGFHRKVGSLVDIGPYEFEDPYEQPCFFTLFKNYTILASEKLKLKKSNTVFNGGLGVLQIDGEATIENKSEVTGISTFVKAIDIDISNNSNVTNPIYEVPDISLPFFRENNRTGVQNLKIDKDLTVVIDDSIFKDIEIDDRAIVQFTAKNIYCSDFSINDDVIVSFAPCTEIMIDDRLDIKKNNQLNPQNLGLNIYARHAHIDEGNLIVANLYTATHIRVDGKTDDPTFLKGQFVGNDIEGDDHVFWDWNKTDPCEGFISLENSSRVNCDDLRVDAGDDKSVLYSARFSFLDRYACVQLNASINGGMGPYSYSWAPGDGLSNPNVLRPFACPKSKTTYILTVRDANGCEQNDTTTIQTYSYPDVFNLNPCQGNPFKIEICDISANTTKCVNIFSNSEINGLGPNLNKGNTLGPCKSLADTPTAESRSKPEFVESGIWPNPSMGTVNFRIPDNIADQLKLTIMNSLGNEVAPDQVKRDSYGTQGNVFTAHDIPPGVYFYVLRSDKNVQRSGRFVVVD